MRKKFLQIIFTSINFYVKHLNTFTMSQNTDPTKVITGVVRFSYCHVFKPTRSSEEEEPRYSLVILIPKSDKATIRAIKAATEEAIVQGVSTRFNNKRPKNLKLPLRDGDDPEEDKSEDPAYQGHYFLTAKSKDAPNIVDKKRRPIADESEVYSGCYGIVSLKFYAFNVKNAGIAVALNNVMKVQDGEPLGARKASADEDFGDIEFDDEEEEDWD